MPKGTRGRGQCNAIVDGERCERSLVANGMCDPHYRRAQQGRPPHKIRKQRYANATLARDADGNKECVYCGRWLPETQFHKGNSTADCLQIFCIPCGERMKTKRHEANPNMRRRAHMMHRYGITLEHYDMLLEQQGGVCAICKSAKPGGRGWHIDHDHDCHPTNSGCPNCVRGILCHGCNIALGALRDNVESLRSAIAYLERARRANSGAGSRDVPQPGARMATFRRATYRTQPASAEH